MINNIWSQGQLFAFSALDSQSYSKNDLTGILCGDKIGIRFYTNVIRELCIALKKQGPYTFEAVTSDYIKINYSNGETASIVYAKQNLIIGSTGENSMPVVNVEGESERTVGDKLIIDNTRDGDFTALLLYGNRFAFAYANSSDEVIKLAKEGLELDLAEQESDKMFLYEKFALNSDNKYSMLYSKCFSTMKTQLYSPEGAYTKIRSTPDRLPHRLCWLWDSVFHAIGFRNVIPSLAEDLILTLFDIQQEDGFIPHCFSTDYASRITQPPVIAWGSYLVYQKSGNIEFLKEVFEHNNRFLLWCSKNRRLTEAELYTWNTQSDANCRCDESGMDNSPRFDIQKRLFAIDFSCFMANETRYMKKIAHILGNLDQEKFFEGWFNQIKNDINRLLWCEQEGFYYDYIIEEHSFNKVSSVASFLPLFSGVCNEGQAEKLLSHLRDPESFYTEFPIPSVSKKDKTFGSDMWRGPVWINYNYMISLGLKEYEYTDFSNEIIDKTIDILNHWYLKKGTVFEFYDSENLCSPCELNRKGSPIEPYNFKARMQSIREYGWSNTLLFDMLHNKFS